MKVALIIPANIWFCPFLKIYTEYFDKLHVDYEVISWNRSNTVESGIQYNSPSDSKARSRFSLLISYARFASFVKKIIIKNRYDKLIVFTPQLGIFLHRFLKKKYNKRYIFDYRDLSIEQNRVFRKPFEKLLNNSYANFISSPGFLKCLPNNVDYNISHNFDISLVRECLSKQEMPSCIAQKIDVLTIGGIRDFSSNAEIIAALCNVEDVSMRFIGKGPSAEKLKTYANNIGCKNILFEGYYPKEKEKEYIKDCTFMNIYYPHVVSHITALSNRFYNALIYKKPMIVSKGGIQGDFVEQYNLGIAIEDCEDINIKLHSFQKHFSPITFTNNCNELLRSFLSDYDKFESILNGFH